MTRRADLKRFKRPEPENPYLQYNLLGNPFPPYGDPLHNVCSDQDKLKDIIVDRLKHFDEAGKRLRVNGNYGAGKTNILRYIRGLTDDAREEDLIESIHPIYVTASGEDYFELHRQIVERLLDRTLDQLIVSLASISAQEVDKLKETFSSSTEVINALRALTDTTSLSNRQATLFELRRVRKVDAFQTWLQGKKISVQDRKDLGGIEDIGSASLAIKFLRGYLDIIHYLKVCRGIILLIDEFEHIFINVPRAKQSRYAQDIRHLMDTLDPRALMVFATIPNPKDLSEYPAVERRLEEPIALEPIATSELAEMYVVDYLHAGRIAFEEYQNQQLEEAQEQKDKQNFKLTKKEREDLSPLSKDIIREVFQQYEVKYPNQPVLPGFFLPDMRERMKEIVEGNA